MSEKDKALRLADAFETHAAIPVGLAMGAIPCVVSRTELSQAAAELRSQHAENERLRELLKEARDSLGCEYDDAVLNLAERIDAFFEQRGVIVGRYGVALRREDKK